MYMIVVLRMQFVNKTLCVLCIHIIMDYIHVDYQSINGKFYIEEKIYMQFQK